MEERMIRIEYAPIESAWKPLIGEGWLVIHCLWVSGRFKGSGYGARLLEKCVAAAREQGKAGVAVVTSAKTKPFLTHELMVPSKFYALLDGQAPSQRNA